MSYKNRVSIKNDQYTIYNYESKNYLSCKNNDELILNNNKYKWFIRHVDENYKNYTICNKKYLSDYSKSENEQNKCISTTFLNGIDNAAGLWRSVIDENNVKNGKFDSIREDKQQWLFLKTIINNTYVIVSDAHLWNMKPRCLYSKSYKQPWQKDYIDLELIDCFDTFTNKITDIINNKSLWWTLIKV